MNKLDEFFMEKIVKESDQKIYSATVASVNWHIGVQHLVLG